MKLNTLKSIDLAGKRVLLRVDYNVAINKGKIEEAFRIDRSYDTIKYLLSQKCQIVLTSHLGRPEGKRKSSLSLKPIYNYLKKDFPKVSMRFVADKIDTNLVKKASKMNESVIFLENLRFDTREEKNDLRFAELLSQFGEVYVNDAFACAHRDSASISGVAKFLPSCAGINVEQEIHYLNRALLPNKPAVAMIGGAKIETKFYVIKQFLKLYNQVLLGGGLANVLLCAKGYDVGGSLVSAEEVIKAKSLLKNKNIILPIDVVVSDAKSKRRARVVRIGKKSLLCGNHEMILDIGPATIGLFAKYLRTAKTIVWNGPMGLFEIPKFSHGTMALAKLAAAKSSRKETVGIVGGGETIFALQKTKMGKYFDFISTGGGAMLEYLEGKTLPGIKPLMKN